MVLNKEQKKDVPVIIDADFGHTTPSFVFPIGGIAEINSSEKSLIKVFYE